MFIKINSSKNFKYVQLARSYRENGKTKHEILFNLGRLDLLENNPEFQKAFTKLARIAGVKSDFNIDENSEAQVFNWGYTIYKQIWEEFKLDNIFLNLQSNTKVQFNLNNACFLTVIQHLLAPSSKLGSYNAQHRYVDMPNVGLNHIYRSLDILSRQKESIEKYLFKMNCTLFNLKIDVVFYDVTTFHFESVQQDELRNFGFSKNAKFNEVQVVLGMLIDSAGRPIGYELFPGNTFEGKTLETALESIEKRFGIRNIIIVADRGLNSKINLKHIVDKGYGYIVASRIKNMPKAVQNEILDDRNYALLSEAGATDTVKYKTIDYINAFKIEDKNTDNTKKRKKHILIKLSEKLIITHSTKRASKDKSDRDRLIKKANNLLQDKSKIKSSNKRGGKKYLKEETKMDWSFDDKLVEEDTKWDGYYGIQTSEKNLSVEKILEAKHTLWRIEESFRIMKTTLEVRPIFHWTEKRIKGHFVICFLAFLLERTLEIKLKKEDIQEVSPEKIREALNSMQIIEIGMPDHKFIVKTKNTELASNIIRELKIKIPKNISTA